MVTFSLGFGSYFSAQQTTVTIANGDLSVRPSVTLVSHAYTVQDIEILFHHTTERCF